MNKHVTTIKKCCLQVDYFVVVATFLVLLPYSTSN
jgi:hypothetical protein